MAESNKNKAGFSLMELLLVIVIISLLTSIVLPALNSVMSKAKKTNCKNHLIQMGRALKVYQEQNGRLVSFPDANGSPFLTRIYGPKDFDIQEAIIFTCPETADSNDGGGLIPAVTTGDSANAVSFMARKNITQTKYPGIFTLDSLTTGTPIAADDWNQPPAANPGDETNHLDSGNFLMLDLHMEDINALDDIKWFALLDPMTN